LTGIRRDTVKIGLIGSGGVGRALIGLIGERDDVELIFVLNSRSGVGDQSGLDPKKLYEFLGGNRDLEAYEKVGFGVWKLDEILQAFKVDLLVEATPTNKRTGEPATSSIRLALENGVHVVTANKGPVILHYRGLKELALALELEPQRGRHFPP
jgi:homoserine dehydrogenase